MRILLVNKFHYQKGGSETYYFGVAEALKALGHEVFFFAMEDEHNLPCDQASFFVSPKDYNGPTSVQQKASAAASLLYSREARDKFEALLQEVKPDVIHLNLVHRQITLSILDAPSAKGIPVVFTAHDYILVCPNYLMLDGGGHVCDDCLQGSFLPCVKKSCVKGSRAKSLLAAAEARFLRIHRSYDKIDCIIAPSEFMARKLIEGGFDTNKVVFMQNFANEDVLKLACVTEDKTDRDNPFLLYAGRLSKEKGVDLLVEAFLQVADRYPSWRLLIAGDGPERESIERMVSTYSGAESIQLLGHLSHDAVQHYLQRASLSVVCSRWRENMPYSVIESLAVGTPVVGSMIGGIPELVVENATGFVCNPEDAQSLCEALVRGVSFCQDVERYQEMQQSCRSYVLEHCSQTDYVEKLTMLYSELIDAKKDA